MASEAPGAIQQCWEMVLEADTADRYSVSGLLVPRRLLVPSNHGAVGDLTQALDLAETLEPARLSESVRLSKTGRLTKAVHLSKIVHLSKTVRLSRSIRRRDLCCVVSVWNCARCRNRMRALILPRSMMYFLLIASFNSSTSIIGPVRLSDCASSVYCSKQMNSTTGAKPMHLTTS